MRPTALFAVLLLAAGCRPSPSDPNQAPASGGQATPPAGEPDPGEAGASDGRPGAPGNGDDASVAADDRRPGPPLPDGPLCDSNADCGEGMVCEGVGCETGQGRCVSTERMCTRDLAEYCGCDGQTFQGSGSCPGGRYAYRGPCEPKLADGQPCTDGRQCASGMCLGEGLEGCSPGAQGECVSEVACTMDLASYCGCNNVEFQASGSCPNRQFAYRGPCEG